ncbi:tRNA 2-selenouridine(34) synthase MnmH [Taibaiella koreensis]|uniref:tRNA 2-selenouridine(34) synthase MnmH n=1 Tax=Taibaiella koreensis TaxID=1268548 RepID=UPI000E5A0476|nr:tRNA 2-selenouridine(34) synthase MnmH [Taibaiella koreensis]
MIHNITIDEFLKQASTLPLVDVRTPAEYLHGRILGAYNVALFTNEERVQVGTTYKQVGREQAILLGFDYVGPRWSGYIRQCLDIAPDKRIAVHCWRGGMRSGAMAWALNLYGFDVYLVQGGYKAYRRWCHRQFARSYNLHMLGGMTGSGKTRMLQLLQAAGQQVVDLEDLAQHQGSAYGTMNRLVQPTQEQFENNLAWRLQYLDTSQPLWLEDECQMIGKRCIPLPLWQQMRVAPLIDLQVPTEQRVASLVQEYGSLDPDFLIESTERIHKRLGPEQTKNAIAAIREGCMTDFIRIVLVYYDKTYRKGLERRNAGLIRALPVNGLPTEADMHNLVNIAATYIAVSTAPGGKS